MKKREPLRRGAAATLAITAIVATIGLAAHPGSSAQAATAVAKTDRIIVKYREQNASESRASRMSSSRARSVEDAAARSGMRITPLRSMAYGAQVLKLDRFASISEVERIARRIRLNDPNVLYAEPDWIMKPQFTPNDTSYSKQWHYYEATGGINMPAAWDKATGKGVVVAVLDTGILQHPDIAANLVSGYDMISYTERSVDGDGRDTDPSDPGDHTDDYDCGPDKLGKISSWHGLHVAGTIAAVTNNSKGVAGVAYDAKVQPIRVLGKCGGYTSDIADGMIWASGGTVSGVPANSTPAQVLNLSLGDKAKCDTTTQNAINSARSRGVTVVVAAGNDSESASLHTPANCAGVITVAATNRSGGRAKYSNYGSTVTLSAPGGEVDSVASDGILSTLNTGKKGPVGDNYVYYEGTSMATPHVAGVIALMLEKNRSLTPDQVKSCLQNTARALPGSCTGGCGSGIVDALAAVDAAIANNCDGGGGGGGGTIAEAASNDTRATAQVIASAGTVNGTVSSSSDTDYFRISLPAGKRLTATLTPNASADYDVYLYNSSGRLITSSTNDVGVVDSASTTNSGSSAATIYVRVRYYSGTTGSSGKYSLGLSW
jgi:serine protease